MPENKDPKHSPKPDKRKNSDFSEDWYFGRRGPVPECSWCGESPVVYSEPGGFYLCESCAENAGRY